ncbi:MAG TPA: dual specificity protein phosphatase family protein, partial [Solirubrobacteraceae bacterium]|nr:dual specificity protein phosphatase family protein [Solirubrobacteraceae bacterium]
GERVYVHCRAGMQRSAVVAAAVVALHEGIEPREALELVRRRNPQADPLSHQRRDLWRWWDARRA